MAYCEKILTLEFKSKYGVMVTVDSAYGNNKIPNVYSWKVLCNYFGETISGQSGAGKLFQERCAYGNASGKTYVGVPEM